MILHVMHSSGATCCRKALSAGGAVVLVEVVGVAIVVVSDRDWMGGRTWGVKRRNEFPPSSAPSLPRLHTQSRSETPSPGRHAAMPLGFSDGIFSIEDYLRLFSGPQFSALKADREHRVSPCRPSRTFQPSSQQTSSPLRYCSTQTPATY